jgi:hypothetical protein
MSLRTLAAFLFSLLVVACVSRQSVELPDGDRVFRERRFPAGTSTPAGARPQEPGRGANFYDPLPRNDWIWVGDLTEAAPVVVVSALFAGDEDSKISGNGVVVDAGDSGVARILTCAHLVSKEDKDLRQVHVGIFQHTFRCSPRDDFEYQEFKAEVLAADDDEDLALLAFPVPAELAAASVAEDGCEPWEYHFISVVPFREPRRYKPGWIPCYVPGQSGSPDLRAGRICGLAQGNYDPTGGGDCLLDKTAFPSNIAAFLAAKDL